MARLQILELPTVYRENGTDETPFVLVIDEYTPQRYILGPDQPEPVDQFEGIAEKIGARAILAFEETINIPANDTTACTQPLTTALHLDDLEVRGAIAADMNKVRQQAGVATIGQHLADERTDIARDMDRLAKRRDELAEALGMEPTRDWDDIRNAAAGIRRSRDSMRDAIQRVRNLDEEPAIMDAHQAEPTGYLLGYAIAIRAAKQASREQPTHG